MTSDDFLRSALGGARTAARAGAPIEPAAAAAHAANETAYGASGLTQRANNLFGVKATGQHTPFWDGDFVTMQTWEVIGGQNVMVDAKFRKYESWAHSFSDYGDVIRRVYPRAAAARTASGFLAGLFLTGPSRWATDPAAFDKVARILGRNEAVLSEGAEEGATGIAHTLVVTNLRLAERWALLHATRNASGQLENVLRGSFVWRVRGDRVDVRRAA